MSGKPDFTVKVKAREGKYATKVGAAWHTRSGGGVNIKLDPGIAIVSMDGVDITLWPFEEREGGGSQGGSRGGSGGGGYGGRQSSGGSGATGEGDGGSDYTDDDVPFVCNVTCDARERWWRW